MEKNITTETQKHVRLRIADCGLRNYHPFSPSPFLPFFFTALCLCVSVVNLSCRSKPTDLRTVIPADSLVYLETNDLGKALRAVTENEAFKAAAKTQPDFSALSGMKLAVAVTGFETKEDQVTDENSVLNFKPRFVAVVETNAWNYQALSFTENKLGEFINETYGGEVVLETADKYDGKYFVWTAKDGRKAYALVRGSLIFFGNDESAIDKCLAVTRGEADSIAKNPKITAFSGDSLASGYISTDGVAQISNIAALKFAGEASEESEVQSAIAGILPQLLRNSITEISWTATKTEQGIEDNYLIVMPSDVANLFSETMAPDPQATSSSILHLPTDIPSATFYNFKNPQIAWRSLLLICQKQVDPLASKVIAEFSTVLLERYAIRDPEAFLKAVRPKILTANFSPDGEEPIIAVTVADMQDVKKSITPMADHFISPNRHGVIFWFDDNKGIKAGFNGNEIVVGSHDGVSTCFDGGGNNSKYSPSDQKLRDLAESTAPIATLSHDIEIANLIIGCLSAKKAGDTQAVSTYLTETRFTKSGIERRTVSDFGLIGSIIAQLGRE